MLLSLVVVCKIEQTAKVIEISFKLERRVPTDLILWIYYTKD